MCPENNDWGPNCTAGLLSAGPSVGLSVSFHLRWRRQLGRRFTVHQNDDHSIIHSTCPYSSLSTLIGSGNKIYGERNLIYIYICKYIYCMCVYLYLNIYCVCMPANLWILSCCEEKAAFELVGWCSIRPIFLTFFFFLFFFENVWQTPPFSGVPSQVWRGVKLGHEPSLFSELAVMEVLQDVSGSWKFFF